MPDLSDLSPELRVVVAYMQVMIQQLQRSSDDRLRALELKISELQTENTVLRQKLLSDAVPAPKSITADSSSTVADSSTAPRSFVEAVKKPAVAAPKKSPIVKAAAKMLSAPPPPMQWVRGHFMIRNARPLETCKTAKDARAMIRAMLTQIGISRRDVKDISRISKNIVEFYAPVCQKSHVEDKLAAAGLELNWNYKFWEAQATDKSGFEEHAIRRLTGLYANAKFKLLKECIVADLPESWVSKIVATASASSLLDAPMGNAQ
ncbi:hypothetical protein EDD86DRAFT_249004 [Gorgonomyces haynaldii]|nr:hypothetical protein EDD86DRAFT_249004 [Gorgonomyces haynaldii]